MSLDRADVRQAARRILRARPRSDLATLLEGALPRDHFSEDMWLTSYVDQSRTRPADRDLFFEVTDETEPVIPPPTIRPGGTREIPLCFDVIFVIGLSTIVVRERRRRGSSTQPKIW